MESNERINTLIQEDLKLTKNMLAIERAVNAKVKFLRVQIREQGGELAQKLEEIKERRSVIRGEILEYWKKNHDSEVRISFPASGLVRRNHRDLTVHDKVSLVNALDRAGRLDLVDYVFKGNEIAKLYAKGKLPGVTKKVAEVNSKYILQVGRWKGQKSG